MNVLIVGGGRIGSYLTGLLLEGGHEVKLIELDGEVVERLQRDIATEWIVHGSGTDADLLERVGIHRADVVVAVTNRDETNLVVTSLAKYEFHVPRVIGRVTNP